MEPKIETHHHHILPPKVALIVGAILLVLTGVTVWIAGVDLGELNFLIAMVVATTKALLVGLIFMNLLYDRRENALIFVTSFVFLAIFIVFTGTDLFFRGDVEVKGPLMTASTVKSKVVKPWIATPALLSHGKELFGVQCVSCHGVEGKGDGPAATALNPRPRNFIVTEGWKNGRKPSQIFKTLKEGIPGSAMASYATLSTDDRWALVHYVDSLGPKAPEDSPSDLAAVGVDVNKGTSEEKADETVPVEFAMKLMQVPGTVMTHKAPEQVEAIPSRASLGAQIYTARCAQCHGDKGEGGVQVETVGVSPPNRIISSRFSKQSYGMKSQSAFNEVVVRGLPGRIMPADGSLSSSELRALYDHVSSLAR